MKPYYQDEYVTIYHGDCREILPELPKVDLVLTDPPYNGDIIYGEKTNDSRDWGVYINWLAGIIKLSEKVCSGPVIYFVSHHGLIRLVNAYPPYWVGAWFQPSPSGNPVGKVGATLIMPYWEPYLIYGDLKTIKASLPDYCQSPVNKEYLNHPCPKPLNVMLRIISSGDFGLILDPFVGSGTTAFAAKKLNRKCIGIEIEEKYCEIAANRCRQMVFDLSVT